MKLRNKKTGDAVYVDFQIPLSNNNDVLGYYSVTSLKKLNESFEDYMPTDPLIKDKKIRKAVRAWWEAVSGAMSDKRILYKKSQDFAVGIYTIYCGAIYSEILEGDKMYTITELCGEGEE